MKRRVIAIIALVIWVIAAFIFAELFVSFVFFLLSKVDVSLSFLNDTIAEALIGAIVYAAAIALTVGLPWLLKKHTTSLKEIGLDRLISWSDIGLVVPAVVLYVLLDAILLWVAGQIHGFNATMQQDVGFTNLIQGYQYALAFITLVVVAPLAEETLFRGYLFGKIRKRAPFWVTMLLVSLAFASLHVPGIDAAGHFQAQWNVAVDVFGLSLVLCGLRELTGSIWSGVLLHALKNGLAFYILFIAPMVHM